MSTDDQLDRLDSYKVAQLERRADKRDEAVDERFEKLEGKVDRLTWVIVTSALAITVSSVGLAAAVTASAGGMP